MQCKQMVSHRGSILGGLARCERNALPGSEFCKQHAPKSSDREGWRGRQYCGECVVYRVETFGGLYPIGVYAIELVERTPRTMVVRTCKGGLPCTLRAADGYSTQEVGCVFEDEGEARAHLVKFLDGQISAAEAKLAKWTKIREDALARELAK